MNKLRGAFIGFGNIAAFGHWPSYADSKEIEIVAAVDASEARRRSAEQMKPGLKTYDSVDALLAKESLDFVDICTPPASHAGLALTALRRGCHVLCEKPLSLKAAEYQELDAAMRAAGKTVFTVHNWKYAPIFQKAFQILAQGRIGNVWHVEIFVLRNNVCKGAAEGASPGLRPPSPGGRGAGGEAENWRTDPSIAGGGILVDHGWHSFYLLMNLVKAKPQRVLSKMLRSANEPNALEEAAQTLVTFPAADGYIHLTWRSQLRRNSVIVQGTAGTLLLDDDRILLTTHAGEREEIKMDAALSAGSHHADWFRALLPDFLQEITNPAQRGVNFQEAGWCLGLTSAAYESNIHGFREIPVVFPTASQQPVSA